jgi:histidinol dehydrogenase
MHEPRALVPALRTSGAIFVGPLAAEAVGDYLAGPNHVLPTGGAARHASPLGVHDFRKRTSIIEYSADSLRAQADDIMQIAAVEGLDAHGRSVAIRVEDLARDDAQAGNQASNEAGDDA